MNKEKLYMGVDYPKAFDRYEFHMKDGSAFVAFCEQDGGLRWKLENYLGSKRHYPPMRINIEEKDVDYFLNLSDTVLWF